MLKKLLLLLLSAFVAVSLQANASIISFDVDYSTIHTGVNTGTDLGMGSGVFYRQYRRIYLVTIVNFRYNQRSILDGQCFYWDISFH